MTKIFRIEKINGGGMYGDNSIAMTDKLTELDRHPLPCNDSLLMENMENGGVPYINSYYYFGFSSLEQLKTWIYNDDWRKSLKKAGFSIKVYESNEFFIGNTQAIFIKERATLLETLDITEI